MPVFDGKTKTATRIPLDGDDWTPSMGALAKDQSPAEKALIHGDQDRVIEGNLTSLVIKSRTYRTNQDCSNTIRGKHVIKEGGDLHHFTGGNHRRDVAGAAILSFLGPVTSTYISPLTENHLQQRIVNEPTTKFEYAQQSLKQHNIELEAASATIDLAFATFTAVGADLYLKGSAFGLTGVGYEDTKFNPKKEDAKIEIHSTVYTKLVMTNIHVSGLFLISGTSVSAGPKLAPNSICM